MSETFKPRTLWRFIPIEDGKYQIQDVSKGTYLFVGHKKDKDGDNQLFAGTRVANSKRSHFEIINEDGDKIAL